METKKTYRVLLVDDDASWQNINKIVLGKQGYQMDSAYNKQDAIKKIDENHYEIAVVDLRLQDDDQRNFDGIDIIKYLRKNNPSIRILVKSGYLSPDVEKELQSIRIDGIFDKSSTNHDLVKRINMIHQKITRH